MMSLFTRDGQQVISPLFYYFLMSVFLGIEFSVRTGQVVFYFQHINITDIALWQGISLAISDGSALIYSLPFGYLCDTYGNARVWLSILHLFCLLSTLLYGSMYSSTTMLLGLFLRGAIFGLMTIYTGELAKIYGSSRVTGIFGAMSLGSGLGIIIGPCFTIAFHKVDFNFWFIRINCVNGPVFIGSICVIMLQMVLYFTLVNSEDVQTGSKYSKHRETSKMQTPTVTLIDIGPIQMASFLWKQTDLIVVYSGSFMWVLLLVSFEAMIPLVSANWLQLDTKEIGIVYLATGIMLTTMYFASMFVQKKDVYICTAALAIMQLLVPALVMVIYKLNVNNQVTRYVYFLWVLIGTVSWLLDTVFAKSLSSQITPLEIQSFGEGFRSTCGSMGRILSSVMVWVWFNYPMGAGLFLLLIGSLQVGAVIFRWKTLKAGNRISFCYHSDQHTNTTIVE